MAPYRVNDAFMFHARCLCIKISITDEAGFALFLWQAVRETRDRCTSGSLIYRGPKQTDRETCCEFFTGKIVLWPFLSSSLLSSLPPPPTGFCLVGSL